MTSTSLWACTPHQLLVFRLSIPCLDFSGYDGIFSKAVGSVTTDAEFLKLNFSVNFAGVAPAFSLQFFVLNALHYNLETAKDSVLFGSSARAPPSATQRSYLIKITILIQ